MSEGGGKFGSWSNPSWWNLLVQLPWVVAVMGLLYSGISDIRISERQKTAEGLITVHEPQNHDRYGYVFFVDGKSYKGWESPRKDGFLSRLKPRPTRRRTSRTI